MVEDDSASLEIFGCGLLFTSLVFLGTWPALLRLSSTAPSSRAPNCFLTSPCLNNHNRDARFAYLDYALSYVVSSSIPLVISILIMDTSDGGKEEEDDGLESENDNTSSSSSLSLILFAFIGGCLLSMGNISMQWAITVFGAPLTTVLAIQASLTVTLGTSINYLLQPSLTSRLDLLLMGVFTFLVAIGLATRAHLLYGLEGQQEHRSQLHYQKSSSSSILGIEMKEGQHQQDHHHGSYGSLESNDSIESPSSSTSSSSGTDRKSTPILIVEDGIVSMEEQHHHIKKMYNEYESKSKSPKMALFVAIFGGCCFGFFSPAFNIAVNDPFHWTAANGGNDNNNDVEDNDDENMLHLHPLSVPIANLWFSLAFTIASFAGNIPLMYYPPSATAPSNVGGVNMTKSYHHYLLPKVTITDYIYGESLSERKLAIYAGLLCGLANLLQFQGGNIIGFATADLVQAYPLISTIWDIRLFGEYRNAGRTVIFYLGAMYVMYTCGIAFLIASSAS